MTTGHAQQARVVGTGGYFATSELVLHFGLGDWSGPASVEVTWPDGTATESHGVAVDRTLAISAGARGPKAGRLLRKGRALAPLGPGAGAGPAAGGPFLAAQQQ